MLVNWHHMIVDYVLEMVITGKISRLVINVAPGYTKTEQVVINFITRGLALNPRAKFIHASYSGDLAYENSSKIKDTIELDTYQTLFPMDVRIDTKGKRRWFTEMGGGMMAAPAGGQITGFRAGRMEKGFTGALIVDDPLKPDDAYSMVRRSGVNNRFNNTMRSRLAVESIPLLVVMQRLHDDDLTAYLLRGGSGDKWHHLCLQTRLLDSDISTPYPEEFTHGIPLNINKILTSIHTGKDYVI